MQVGMGLRPSNDQPGTTVRNCIHIGLSVRKSFNFAADIQGMAESASSLAPLHPHPGRQHERTHMFVAASICSEAGSCPVRIRNMSLSGALIEGAIIPEPGVLMTLRRGSLHAAAKIVWKVNRKAGVAFSTTVEIADWMSRNPPSHQAKVDEIMRGIRGGISEEGPAPAARRPEPTSSSLEMELNALKAELVALENGLTNDMDVVAAHPEIQLLDIALQRVGRMLAGVQSF
jgi:hypothetical protein